MDTREFERELGYTFRDVRRLLAALTHSSFANEAGDGSIHNERPEFLGDAVLSLCVSNELFFRFPNAREGELTRLRAQLVNASALAALAREIGLDRRLRLGKGEESQGGRSRDTLLGDALEAVLGAVFEDGGFEAALALVRRWFAGSWPEGPAREMRKDYKTRLQERIQKQCRDRPVYSLESDRGPEHAKVFEVRLVLPDGRDFTGRGSSVKKAEQAAAQNALHTLDGEENPGAAP